MNFLPYCRHGRRRRGKPAKLGPWWRTRATPRTPFVNRYGSPSRHSGETTRLGSAVTSPKWAYGCRYLVDYLLDSPQGETRFRNQIRKNSDIVPRPHPHRCRSRLDQALTGPKLRTHTQKKTVGHLSSRVAARLPYLTGLSRDFRTGMQGLITFSSRASLNQTAL